MRYFVTFDEAEVAVDVVALPGGAFDIRLDGTRVDADVVAIGDTLSIRIGQQIVDLTTEGRPPDLGVVASGHRAYVTVESERLRAASAARRGKGGAGHDAIVSPMPGRVVKLLVEPGAEVQADDPVVVVEAMKMENELRASRAGKVARVLVQVGDAVEGGAPLVELEP
jgi:biotin carboxyl carrier protein